MAKIKELVDLKESNGKVFNFCDVIESIDNHKVIRFSRENAVHLLLLEKLKQAAENTVATVNGNVNKKLERANEFGNYVQSIFSKECNKLGIVYETPKDTNGKAKTSGYPDGFIKFNNQLFYLEIKTYAEEAKDQTFRTFFYSPSSNSKIIYDAVHLLVGFSTEGFNLTGYTYTDMYNKKVELKQEFNQNNKEMYKATEQL